jgi:hypothetical protein
MCVRMCGAFHLALASLTNCELDLVQLQKQSVASPALGQINESCVTPSASERNSARAQMPAGEGELFGKMSTTLERRLLMAFDEKLLAANDNISKQLGHMGADMRTHVDSIKTGVAQALSEVGRLEREKAQWMELYAQSESELSSLVARSAEEAAHAVAADAERYVNRVQSNAVAAAVRRTRHAVLKVAFESWRKRAATLRTSVVWSVATSCVRPAGCFGGACRSGSPTPLPHVCCGALQHTRLRVGKLMRWMSRSSRQ